MQSYLKAYLLHKHNSNTNQEKKHFLTSFSLLECPLMLCPCFSALRQYTGLGYMCSRYTILSFEFVNHDSYFLYYHTQLTF